MNNIKFILLFLIGMLIVSISCDSEFQSDSSTSDATFELKWKDDPAPMNRALNDPEVDCVGKGISKVEVSMFNVLTLWGSSVEAWPCSQGEGILYNIPFGIDYIVYVKALDFSGTTIYTGEKSGIEIKANDPNHVGVIDMVSEGGGSEVLDCQQDECTNSNLGMTFKSISAGTFTMGSPSSELGRGSDEVQHQVTLTNDFYIMTTEVTQKQWTDVMGSNPSYFTACGENCPVERVSWNDIQTFITAMNARGESTYRLPTEAEWEYAARAGSTTAFTNGDITQAGTDPIDPNLDAMGWYGGNANSTTHPVAQKQANAWGLYDMHGNVFEWCQDWYGDYPTTDVTDPTGASTGSYRVLRGGSFSSYALFCRSADRYIGTPGVSGVNVGFRLVVSIGH